MREFSIKPAKPEYAVALTEITITAKRHWNYPEKWMQEWLPALTISPDYIVENETWVVVVDDKPVAYCSLKLHSVIARRSLPKQSLLIMRGLLTCTATNAVRRKCRREEHPPRNDGEDLWLDNLWVSPEFIGQGIGRNLFDHAMERARIRGFANLKIEADPNAVPFYEKMGARKIGEQRGEVNGQPRILPVMEINL